MGIRSSFRSRFFFGRFTKDQQYKQLPYSVPYPYICTVRTGTISCVKCYSTDGSHSSPGFVQWKTTVFENKYVMHTLLSSMAK